MITTFGKELRKLRIDKGEILKNMADKLKITSAYLSAIECGKREIPSWFIGRMKDEYQLSPEQEQLLKSAKDESVKEVILHFENATSPQRELALKFARTFKDMTIIDIEAFKKLLDNLKNNGGD